MQTHTGSRVRILMVVNVDWFFLSHRLPIARAARDQGADVWIAAADTGRADSIRREGFSFQPIPLSRSGINLIAELRTVTSLAALYRRTRPDLIHQVTIKPVIYGSLAAQITRQKAVVNAISGLGYSFSEDRHAGVLRPLTKCLYRWALGWRGSTTVFQNPEDQDDFVRMGLVPSGQSVLIRGSGVDCSRFRLSAAAEGRPVVALAGRMLWHKGVGIFVEAARMLRETHPEARFVLVGGVDRDNPSAIPADRIRRWVDEGVVEWWGERSDMPEVLAGANIVALPVTHREGLPKVLLEAAACGRPIVAADVPGCREIARPGVNGLLVPPGDGAALARAFQDLLESPELCDRLGRAGREIAEREFSTEIVVRQTLDLYRKMLGGKWPRTGATP